MLKGDVEIISAFPNEREGTHQVTVRAVGSLLGPRNEVLYTSSSQFDITEVMITDTHLMIQPGSKIS